MAEEANDMEPAYEGIPVSLTKNEKSPRGDSVKNTKYQYYERLAKFTTCIAAFVYLATSYYLFLPTDYVLHVSTLHSIVEEAGDIYTSEHVVPSVVIDQTMTKNNLDGRNEISLDGYQKEVDEDENDDDLDPPSEVDSLLVHQAEKGELKRHSINIMTSAQTNDCRIFDGKPLSELRSSNKNRAILVYFYTTWCAQCQKNLPMWETLTEEGAHGALIFKVDCEAHKEVCRQQGIRAYPSINLFIHGTTSVYGGIRQTRYIRSFVVEKMIGKDDVEENLQNDMSQASNSWEVSVEHAARIKNYQSALADSENVVIVFTSSATYCSKCRNFRQTWQNYAKHVHSAGMTNLLVAEVDCLYDQCPPGPYPRYEWYHEGALVGGATIIVDPSSTTVESLMTTTRMVLDMEAQHSFV